MEFEAKAMEKSISLLMEKALGYFAGPQFKNEIESAKREFFQPLSTPEEMSPKFEVRMSQFYDWYFFTRPLQGFRQTPLEAMNLTRDLRFSADEETLIETLKQHRHSLFEFVSLKPGKTVVRDLLKNEKLTVQSSTFSFDSRLDEVFEARLAGREKDWIFLRGFCFHPVETKKFILGEVKKHRKDADLDRRLLILNLLKMNMRMDQYKHVPLEKIYSAEKM